MTVAFNAAGREVAIADLGYRATRSFAPARAAGRRVADHI
jgi:hypothetical protein